MKARPLIYISFIVYRVSNHGQYSHFNLHPIIPSSSKNSNFVLPCSAIILIERCNNSLDKQFNTPTGITCSSNTRSSQMNKMCLYSQLCCVAYHPLKRVEKFKIIFVWILVVYLPGDYLEWLRSLLAWWMYIESRGFLASRDTNSQLVSQSVSRLQCTIKDSRLPRISNLD